jgi:hypothetical protein
VVRITASERKALPRKDFALPGKGTGPGGKGPGSYPIDTAGRARNALSRISEHGTSSEKSVVRAAVKRKYPSIRQDSKNGTRGNGSRRPKGDSR